MNNNLLRVVTLHSPEKWFRVHLKYCDKIYFPSLIAYLTFHGIMNSTKKDFHVSISESPIYFFWYFDFFFLLQGSSTELLVPKIRIHHRCSENLQQNFFSCRFSVIPILADILSDSVKEKVTRIILAVFRVCCCCSLIHFRCHKLLRLLFTLLLCVEFDRKTRRC